MYYVILGVIALLLFILRKRIYGGIVGVITLILMVSFTIFMFDFFWIGTTKDGSERDIRDFEPTQEVVKEYDDTVKDPKSKSEGILNKLKGKSEEANKKLVDAGDSLDEKIGITKDGKNNNLWGSSEDETSDEEESHESQEEEQQLGLDEGNNVDEGSSQNGESDTTEVKNTKSKIVSHENIKTVQKAWGLSDEDYKFVRSASPFTTGEFSNGSITIKVTKEGVELKE